MAGCWLLWCSWGLNQQLEERWIKSLKKNEHNKLLQRDPCIKNGRGGVTRWQRGLIINGGKGHRLSRIFLTTLAKAFVRTFFVWSFMQFVRHRGIQITCLDDVLGLLLAISFHPAMIDYTCDFAHLILSAGRHHCLPRCCDCKEQEKKPSADSSVNEYGAQSCIEAISKHIQYMTVHEMLPYAYLKIFIYIYIEYMIRE